MKQLIFLKKSLSFATFKINILSPKCSSVFKGLLLYQTNDETEPEDLDNLLKMDYKI